MKFVRIAALWASALVISAPAFAKSPEETLRDALIGGGFEAGLSALSAAKTEPAVAAAWGVMRFSRGIERFAQAMYRHGLRPGGRSAAPMLLGMNLPQGNPNPQPLSYEEFRKILSDLSADMAAVDERLSKVGEAPLKLRLDLHTMRIDINADGKADPDEELFSLVRAGAGMMGADGEKQPFIVAFDTADVQWLRGYSNLIGAVVDFWLAYDFKMTFDSAFQAFFPANAPTPEAKRLAEGAGSYYGTDGRDIADLVAMIHLINWMPVEPERLASARLRLLKVGELNRLTWKLARAETDDDHEWLPNAKQSSSAMSFMAVSDERIDSWLAAVAEIEDVLEGRKLMPHWRFSPPDMSLAFEEPKPGAKEKPFIGEGINVKRLFLEPRPFDLVLWVTGHGAVPYLEKGEVARFNAWSQAERIFEGNLFAYAFYFN